jgi:hypothetical protein
VDHGCLAPPALADALAFRFTFVTERINKRKLLAWARPDGEQAVDRAKAAGTLDCGQEAHRHPRSGVHRQASASGKQRLRAKVVGNQNLVWQQR